MTHAAISVARTRRARWRSFAASRLRASFAAVVALLLVGTLATPPTAEAADPPPCVDGFGLVAPTNELVAEDVHGLSANRVLVAGGKVGAGGRRSASIARYDKSGWHRQSTKSFGSDSGYVALGGTRSTRLWAVGYAMTFSSLAPLAVRQKPNGAWRRVNVPKPRRGGATLTDVAGLRRNAAWAVGYRLARPGVRRPFALRWDGRRWNQRDPGLAKGERGMLAGLSSSTAGGTWIAGSVSRNGVERPYIAQRRNGGWKRIKLPAIGSGSLAAVEMTAKDDGWAVGHRVGPGGIRPLVLRRDESGWRIADPPSSASDALLVDITIAPDDTVRVSGSVWSASARKMLAMTARFDRPGWTIRTLGTLGNDALFTTVEGDPGADGWLSGRTLRSGLVAQTCAGSTLRPAGRKRLRQQRRQRSATVDRRSNAPGHPTDPAPPPRAGLTPAARVQTAAPIGVVIRDVASAVGLPTRSITYGATVRDFDGNGSQDIFLNRHGGPAALFLDNGGAYQDAGVDFRDGDRHGCAAADLDGSGLPDLYCSFGGGRGLGVSGNQLWLDPGGSDPKLQAQAGGAPEPLGRGRLVAIFDADGDGRDDLYLGQGVDRLDGLPSHDRVYRRTGPGAFAPWPKSGVGNALGAEAIDTGDVDRDGRVDVLLAYHDPKAAGRTNGLRLYRNTVGGFRNASSRFGIRSIGERDAELVRLDHDQRPDLVQLSKNRIRISLQRDGRFKMVFERAISGAVAVAAGDADGDGDTDLYILRQKDKDFTKDLILFNQGNGRSYRAVKAPSRKGGQADDVVALDHDQNGLTDFLALNGGGAGKGPLQLIAFYPR